MSSDNTQALAQEGLRQIEASILRLLDANPQGLRNADIARNLGLAFNFAGNYKNQVTYAVLGGLMAGEKLSGTRTPKFSLAKAGTILLWT